MVCPKAKAMENTTFYELVKETRDDVKWIRDKVVTHDILLKEFPERLNKIEQVLEDLQALRWKIVGLCIGLIIFIEGSHIGLEKLFENWK